jgi:hypothetical protein
MGNLVMAIACLRIARLMERGNEHNAPRTAIARVHDGLTKVFGRGVLSHRRAISWEEGVLFLYLAAEVLVDRPRK